MTANELRKRINASLLQQRLAERGRYDVYLGNRGETFYTRASTVQEVLQGHLSGGPAWYLGSVQLPLLTELTIDHQGDFTAVEVTGDGISGRGYAKRNARLVHGKPVDRYDPAIGQRVALRRAMEQYRQRVLGRATKQLLREHERLLSTQGPNLATHLLEEAPAPSLAACAKPFSQGNTALSSTDSGATTQRLVIPVQAEAATGTGDV